MKNLQRPLFLLFSAALLGGCASTSQTDLDDSSVGESVVIEDEFDGKSVAASDGEYDDLDEYDAVTVPDPLEPLNRATFMLNEGLYIVLLRPITTGYEFLVPTPGRTALTNVFENVKYPVRFVNSLLQGKFERMAQETGKFLLNTSVGVGGIWKPSDKVADLADLPTVDTAQTFAKWGIPHGAYLVLPVLGPNSIRDTIGWAGDAALNPVTYVGYFYNGTFFGDTYDWTIAFPAANALRAMPEAMDNYDAATENALDPYVSARTFYIQYREQVAAQ
jgi:phospholipid-binding lipoprotein MlaA